jgi:geranylgeranyl reductase family protein
MQQESEDVKQYDVLIIGAGPGGCSAALTLRNSGLKVALIDKAAFPRDKVCGELMHRKAVRTLNSILPEFEEKFKAFPKTSVMKHTCINYKGKMISFDWENESYTCARIHLDNFLLKMVGENSNTDVFTRTAPDVITVDDEGVTVTVKNAAFKFRGKVIIGADGATSTVARQLTTNVKDKKHYIGAVRAYYKNVKDIQPDVSEVYFDSRFQMNYLWVFPEKDGLVNVGFGLLSRSAGAKKINLKDAFAEFFERSPKLAYKFADAEMVGSLDGFGVPLGSGIGTISGNRFMLTGDAASLSNPLSGTGMGNAIVSGKLAADQALRCCTDNDYSEAKMMGYNNELQTAVVNDLMASYKAQRTFSKIPYLLDLVFMLTRIKSVKKYIQSVI